jgi:hypothetical protein
MGWCRPVLKIGITARTSAQHVHPGVGFDDWPTPGAALVGVSKPWLSAPPEDQSELTRVTDGAAKGETAGHRACTGQQAMGIGDATTNPCTCSSQACCHGRRGGDPGVEWHARWHRTCQPRALRAQVHDGAACRLENGVLALAPTVWIVRSCRRIDAVCLTQGWSWLPTVISAVV